MKAIYAIIFILISIFSSCKKYSGPTTAQGQVVDAITLKGIPYAEVWLMRDKGFSAMARTHMETQNTDQNGNFSFAVETESDYRYFLDAAAEHYFKDAEDGYIRQGEKNENMKVKIKPKGYTKLNMINDSSLKYTQISISGSFNPSFRLHGEHKDTIIFLEMLGDEEGYININRTTRSENKLEQLKVYFPALDTLMLDIKY